jgi:hypothetical protein
VLESIRLMVNVFSAKEKKELYVLERGDNGKKKLCLNISVY